MSLIVGGSVALLLCVLGFVGWNRRNLKRGIASIADSIATMWDLLAMPVEYVPVGTEAIEPDVRDDYRPGTRALEALGFHSVGDYWERPYPDHLDQRILRWFVHADGRTVAWLGVLHPSEEHQVNLGVPSVLEVFHLFSEVPEGQFLASKVAPFGGVLAACPAIDVLAEPIGAQMSDVYERHVEALDALETGSGRAAETSLDASDAFALINRLRNADRAWREEVGPAILALDAEAALGERYDDLSSALIPELHERARHRSLYSV